MVPQGFLSITICVPDIEKVVKIEKAWPYAIPQSFGVRLDPAEVLAPIGYPA